MITLDVTATTRLVGDEDTLISAVTWLVKRGRIFAGKSPFDRIRIIVNDWDGRYVKSIYRSSISEPETINGTLDNLKSKMDFQASLEEVDGEDGVLVAVSPRDDPEYQRRYYIKGLSSEEFRIWNPKRR